MCSCGHLAHALWNAENAAKWEKAFRASEAALSKARAEAVADVAAEWLRGPASGDETSGTYRWLLELAVREAKLGASGG